MVYASISISRSTDHLVVVFLFMQWEENWSVNLQWFTFLHVKSFSLITSQYKYFYVDFEIFIVCVKYHNGVLVWVHSWKLNLQQSHMYIDNKSVFLVINLYNNFTVIFLDDVPSACVGWFTMRTVCVCLLWVFYEIVKLYLYIQLITTNFNTCLTVRNVKSKLDDVLMLKKEFLCCCTGRCF